MRWNNVAVLCQSLFPNEDLIGSCFTSQNILDTIRCDIDWNSLFKPTLVVKFSKKDYYWTTLKRVKSIFNFVKYLVTLLERDMAPISYALFSFSFLFASVDQI